MFRSKATSYAILAASEIAKRKTTPGGPGVQASEVAELYGLPTAYAAKVMSQMAKAQILRSDRGPRGGFQLARTTDKINLLEMYEAVHGILDGGGEMRVDGKIPDHIRKNVTNAFDKATNQMRTRMSAITLSDLLKK
jgi:Rrf2 family protein